MQRGLSALQQLPSTSFDKVPNASRARLDADRRGRQRWLPKRLPVLLLGLCVLLSNIAAGAMDAADVNAETTGASSTAASLEQRTRVIITRSERLDGSIQENRGSGVVVGRYYLTVHHNLQPGPAGRFRSYTSYLGGMPVEPLFSDPAADIAIIPIPSALCPSWCERNELLPTAETQLQETVRWYRSADSAPAVNPGWRRARVMGRTWSLPAIPTVGSLGTDCDAGLVLEVDRPFRPGSSGAGVWDADNQLVGIVQGSFQSRDGRETGYFKPLRCIRGNWPTQPEDQRRFATSAR